MAKWKLAENEKMLGEANASYVTKRLGILPNPHPGKLHVTNQRVVHDDMLTVFFDLPLSQISSFSTAAGKIILAGTDGKTYTITGMFNKKLAEALEQAGVKKA